MVDGLVRKVFAQMLVAHPLIRHEQADLVRDRFFHEALPASSAFTFSITRATTLPLRLTAPATGVLPDPIPPVPLPSPLVVLVPRLAADERFIDFDNAAKLLRSPSGQGRANAMAHIPSRLIRAKAHEAANLQGAHALLAGQHQMRDAEPILQRLIRVLKDRARNMRKAIGRHRRTGDSTANARGCPSRR